MSSQRTPAPSYRQTDLVGIEDGEPTRSRRIVKPRIAASTGAIDTRMSHGMSYTRIYGIWCTMLQRCYRPKAHGYWDYGGRGITVRDLWRWSFENFYFDMGEPPKNMTLDRIDVNSGYCRCNCRWATWTTQNRNTRANRRITFDGRTMTLAGWAEVTGIGRATIAARLNKGIPPEIALTAAVDLSKSFPLKKQDDYLE